MNPTSKKLTIKKDARGWLVELIRKEDLEDLDFGQILLTTVLPGEKKGGHYHLRKTEWYCVIKGDGLVTIINNKTKKKIELSVGVEDMSLVKIPPNNWHEIRNVGSDELYLLACTNESFNPDDPDTYSDLI